MLQDCTGMADNPAGRPLETGDYIASCADAESAESTSSGHRIGESAVGTAGGNPLENTLAIAHAIPSQRRAGLAHR